METARRVRKTDLARNTHQVIRDVQRGEIAVVEHHGEPEAAIIDILDYRILRAVVRFFAQASSRKEAEPETVRTAAQDDPLPAERASAPPSQARLDLILARYLDGGVSLARAAELLGLPPLELRSRFLRLDIPLRTSPEDLAEAAEDVEVALAWAKRPKPNR